MTVKKKPIKKISVKCRNPENGNLTKKLIGYLEQEREISPENEEYITPMIRELKNIKQRDELQMVIALKKSWYDHLDFLINLYYKK